jgi:hypothetical protein
MHTRGSLNRVNHELHITHLPFIITQELMSETNSIGNIREPEDNGANLSAQSNSV